jgi:hypothetical protein
VVAAGELPNALVQEDFSSILRTETLSQELILGKGAPLVRACREMIDEIAVEISRYYVP